MKIYCLTPNPALDLSGSVASLIPNEKNYVQDERRDPGGNGINSARILTRLGAPALALGWAGGATGDEILTLLNRERVPTRFLRIRESNRTNVTVYNRETHQQTRLTFPGPRVNAAERKALLDQLARLRGPGLLLLGGSLPDGCPEDFHVRLGRAASQAGLGVIIDVPARYYARLFAEASSRKGARAWRPLLLKPNQAELEEWLGHRLPDDRALHEGARQLAQRAELVVLSLAERGAILAQGERTRFFPAPRIRARGTVGAGDSMVGAMAWRLARHGLVNSARFTAFSGDSNEPWPPELEEMMAWGLAAGAATAGVSGTGLAPAREIRRLARKLQKASKKGVARPKTS